jgi:hypothetical protein
MSRRQLVDYLKDKKMNRRPNIKGPAPMRRQQKRPNMERPEPNTNCYWRHPWVPPYYGDWYYYDDDYYDWYYDDYYDWYYDDYLLGGYSADPEQAYRKGLAEGRKQAALKFKQQQEETEPPPTTGPTPKPPESNS